MNNQHFQHLLLERIRGILSPSQSLAHELADILEISTDSAYRRIRGETHLSINEAMKLCNCFHFSLDSLALEHSNSVTFQYNYLENRIEHFKNYLNSINRDLSALLKADQKHIIYAAEDIPLFYHFEFPGLAAFKMFYWMKSVLNIPEYESKKFSFDLLDGDILETGKQLLSAYRNINSVEIWTDGILNSIIKQIKFYWDAGLFHSREDAIQLCDLLKEEIIMFQKQADIASKNGNADNNNFQLYISDIEIGNNTILATKNNHHATYITHHTFNFLVSSNCAFCIETRNWLNHLIQKSVLISGVSEKLRYIFFKDLLEKCDNTRKKIMQ